MQARSGDESAEAYISVGSNLGDRLGYLQAAVGEIRSLIGDRCVCSGVYETLPVGVVDQPEFLNMVIRVTTDLRPLALLDALMTIEQKHGRVRTTRYGPRTLDLDLLLFANDYICTQHLQVPHPRMWERAFVLVPLSELAPERRGLGGRSIRALADAVTHEGGIRYVGRFC